MFDPADRRKQILYKAVAALARRERSRLGLYKKLSETFNEEGDKELINSVLDELVNKKYLSDERYARIQVLTRSEMCIRDRPYTADRHLARKVPCQACHVTGDTSVPVRKENCLVCHQSYEVVAQKTKDLKPNPHFNHYGERDCSTCHFGHKPSVTSCNQCHKFDLKTP